MRNSNNTTTGGEVSVLEFGAVGDGVTDDFEALAAALASGAGHVVVPCGMFITSNVLRPAEGQTVEIHGTLRSKAGIIQRLLSDVHPGDSEVVVEDGSVFRVGSWVTLHDDALPIQGGGRKVRRERAGNARVVQIDGNRLILDNQSAGEFLSERNGRVGTQHSVILIEHSGVRICGTGVIDGNRENQLNAAAGSLDRTYGEDWRANCGVSVDGFDKTLSDVIIEGVTIKNAVLHNLALRGVERSVVRNTVCVGAHDKNMTFRRCRDCLIINNIAADSVWEDGIIFHQVADLSQASSRIAVRGNLCVGNARNGISVGANMHEIILSDNLCVDNGINLQITADNCTSTGDTAIGGNGRLFPLDAPRPSVHLRGKQISVRNLTSIGGTSTALEISGESITISGGLIGQMAEALSEGDGVGVAITAPMRKKQQVIPDRIVIEGVDIRGCREALSVAPEAKRLTLRGNHFADNDAVFDGGADVLQSARLVDNDGLVSAGRGVARLAAGETRLTVEHGLDLTPDRASISLTPLGRAAAARRCWIDAVGERSFELVVDDAPPEDGAEFAWRAEAGSARISL